MTNESWPTKQESETNIKKIEHTPEIYVNVQNELTNIFNEFKTPEERINKILERSELFLDNIGEDLLSGEGKKSIMKNILACDAKTKDEFVSEISNALQPLINLSLSDPEKFEHIGAKTFNESGNFTEINRLLSYEKYGSFIYFHAPTGKTVEKKFSLYREGMRELAEIVNNDQEIDYIVTSSFIVASNPGIFTMSGFKIEETTEEEKERYSIGKDEKTKRAIISREDFLKKFLKEK